jgi:hypothetical protein
MSARSSYEIVDLIKGIVLLSRKLDAVIGGSVTPVVPLFNELRFRGAPGLNELSSWVLANRLNEYEPFGGWTPEWVRDHDGYMAWQKACSKRRQERRDSEIARAAFTSSSVSTNVVSLSNTYAAGTGTGSISEAGIFTNATSGGTMLSHVVFSSIGKGALDTLTINWTITIG